MQVQGLYVLIKSPPCTWHDRRVEKNLFRGREKTLLAAIVLFAASAASAVPTVSSGVRSGSTDCGYRYSIETKSAVCVSRADGQLGDIGRAILQPLAGALDAGDTQADNFKSLPGAPAALLMGLMGFLCISAVHDRRAWLAVFACAFWLGQQGVQLVPRLIRYADHNTRSGCEYASESYWHNRFAQSHNGYSDPAAEYIGLLHYLAGIPDGRTAFVNTVLTATDNIHSFLAVAAAVLCAEMKNRCSVSGAEQFVCFTPAFIFSNIPRGPPAFA